MHRINSGESIEIVQEYNPDKLDYYRQDLTRLYEDILPSMTANIPESNYE